MTPTVNDLLLRRTQVEAITWVLGGDDIQEGQGGHIPRTDPLGRAHRPVASKRPGRMVGRMPAWGG